MNARLQMINEDFLSSDDIQADLLENENIHINGHRACLGDVCDRLEQERYEFDRALMRGETPSLEAYRSLLMSGLKDVADRFETEINT